MCMCTNGSDRMKESVSRACFNRHTHWGEILLNVLWNFRLNERRQKMYINWNETKRNEMERNEWFKERECRKSIFIIRYNTRVRDISVDVRTPFSFSSFLLVFCVFPLYVSTISSGHYRFTATLCALHHDSKKAATTTLTIRSRQMAMAWYIGEQNRSN